MPTAPDARHLERALSPSATASRGACRAFARSGFLAVLCALSCGLLGGLSGCSGTRAPAVRVADAAIVGRSADGVAVEFVLEAENPNDAEIPLRGVRYTLELDDGRRFRVERLAEATLASLDTRQLLIPVAIPLGPDRPAQLGYALKGTLEYLEPGAFNEILFDAGINIPTVGFRDAGTIQLVEVGGP